MQHDRQIIIHATRSRWKKQISQSHKRARMEVELAASHLTELDANSEVCTAANVRWAETGLAASDKMELGRNGDICNAAYPRRAETELAASHRMEHAGNGELRTTGDEDRWKQIFMHHTKWSSPKMVKFAMLHIQDGWKRNLVHHTKRSMPETVQSTAH